MITQNELKTCRPSIAAFGDPARKASESQRVFNPEASDLVCDAYGVRHPIIVLFNKRYGLRGCKLYPSYGETLQSFSGQLERQQQQDFAIAVTDWVIWLRDRGCTPGITRALLNGERERILELMDAEITNKDSQ